MDTPSTNVDINVDDLLTKFEISAQMKASFEPADLEAHLYVIIFFTLYMVSFVTSKIPHYALISLR